MSQDFTHSQTFAAPPAQLYRAFTNSTFLREWLSDVATTAPGRGLPLPRLERWLLRQRPIHQPGRKRASRF